MLYYDITILYCDITKLSKPSKGQQIEDRVLQLVLINIEFLHQGIAVGSAQVLRVVVPLAD
ncbi:hypothetical protein A6R68_23501 [Neotoma lepida]|uniref:Uncharacterized protein n=1 Tax=Neotoma lepida TaxID=56216 RepID=A0A1A6HXS3_NEOLE|nr:hypothetical protein A6R68_23501 [Neotoma lepida]